MFRTIHGLTAAALTIAAAAALAQSNAAPAAPSRPSFFQHMLKTMDSNGDGRISLDEYLATAAQHFQSIDSQNKGAVDAADIASSPQAIARIDRRAEHMVKRLDTTGNDYVTQDEFVAAAKRRFAKLDRNGDGKLTPDELRFGRGWKGGNGATQGSGKGAAFAAQRFEKLDANHDGFVTADEYVAAATALFRQFDTAGNGKVTAAEIEAAPKTQERALHVASRMVKRMDTDGDGTVSKDEFLAAAKTRFSKLDKNGDGFIDANEVSGRRWSGQGHGNQG